MDACAGRGFRTRTVGPDLQSAKASLGRPFSLVQRGPDVDRAAHFHGARNLDFARSERIATSDDTPAAHDPRHASADMIERNLVVARSLRTASRRRIFRI